jgi:hypothetical protein
VTHPYNGIPLVVLTGVGRSGTVALREALGRHEQVHSTGSENNILYELLHTARMNCTHESRRFAMQVDDAAYDAAFRQLMCELLWAPPRDPPPNRLLAFTALSPTRADFLCRLFPGVKIAYLLRNGIEVVASRQRYSGFADRPFGEHCKVWALARKLIQWGRDRDDFMLIRHEHLLNTRSLTSTLDRLWSWIGLRTEPASERFLRDNCLHPTRAGDEQRLPGDALGDRSDRWRSWTPSERQVFLETCGEAMASLDYPIPWLDAAVSF